MIPFDFAYLRPDTLEEAVRAFLTFDRAGKSVAYYAGGSEILSMCRVGAIKPEAVVDIKSIPELNALSVTQESLVFGAALTLNQIRESRLFPLLALTCGRIADHTNQCRITLGGNLCGTIRYRETSLPLILSNAAVTLYGPEGARTLPFPDAFCGRMKRSPAEIAVQVRVPDWAATARCWHIKKTAQEKIDYPAVTAIALVRDGALRAAFSGLSESPLQSDAVDAALNDHFASLNSRADEAARLLAPQAHGDAEASAQYRLFVLKNTLKTLLKEFENDPA
jgi:CO/xanthine dehydrogenase FAD-binding subunit